MPNGTYHPVQHVCQNLTPTDIRRLLECHGWTDPGPGRGADQVECVQRAFLRFLRAEARPAASGRRFPFATWLDAWAAFAEREGLAGMFGPGGDGEDDGVPPRAVRAGTRTARAC